MRLSYSVLIVALLGNARPAAAECARDLIRQAVVARITQQSIDSILKPVGALVPENVDFPQTTTEVFSCGGWFDSTTITTERGNIHLALSQIQVDLDGGDVVIDVAGDIEANADLAMEVCLLPNANCSAGVTARGVAVHARAAISVTECVPNIVISEFAITIDNNDIEAHLDDCGAYTYVVEWLEDWLRGGLLDYATQELAAFLPELIQTQLAAVTTELLSSNLEVRDVSFRAQPEWIAIDDTGIMVSFAAASSPDRIADCARGVAIADNRIEPDEGIRLPAGTSIAVSGRLGQNIVTSAWQAGWACLDLSSVAPGVTNVLDSVLPGAHTEVTLEVKKAPRFTLTPSEVGSANLELTDVRGSVRIDVPGDGDYRADFQTSLSIGADIAVTPITRQIALTPREFRMGAVDVTLGQASLGFSEESIDRFVRNEVAPLFTSSLAELPLVSNLFSATLVGVSIDSLATSQNGATAEIEVTGVYQTDDVPPKTTFAKEPQCPCAPELAFTMKSSDDTTPFEMVRHRVEIDGQIMPQLFAGAVVKVKVPRPDNDGGQHRVRVAAVDLAGNVDPDARVMDLAIDYVPPKVSFVNPPIGIIPADGARIAIAVEDETAVADTIDYTVAVVGREAVVDEVFISRTQSASDPIELFGLPDATTIRLRVIGRDRAGNTTEARTSFAVLAYPSMGCAGARPTNLTGLLLLVGLAFARVRRRQRC
ncbi:MAG: hypothetical protein ACAI38_08340 [Myxococcota bacterium]